MEFTKLSNKYVGRSARGYDAERVLEPKWAMEHELVSKFLGSLPSQCKVLDIPVGTGRFVELYQQFSLRATGVDASEDMLAKARLKADRVGFELELQRGDIRKIQFPNDTFDAVLCIRFLNWVDISGVRTALGELARVSGRYVLAGVRTWVPSAELYPISRAAQGATRMRKRINSSRNTIIHELPQLTEAFNSSGLTLEAATRIERTATGTDYTIYSLSKYTA